MAGYESATRDRILQCAKKQAGILFASPAYVYRQVYRGRDIIAKNSESEHADRRGYFKVERWIMSLTEAENEQKVDTEGVTRLLVTDAKEILLTEAIKIAGDVLLGSYEGQWPLTKILDIGGPARIPILPGSQEHPLPPEVPPIPCHVHSGLVCNGHLCGRGKTEAYFFPPLDIPPYNLALDGVTTRLGLQPHTQCSDFAADLEQFGLSDRMYGNLNSFPVRPWETWHIPARTVHAPGPWLTFEIQRPQDDFNLLAWQWGRGVGDEEERLRLRDSLQLRGLADTGTLLEEAVDWDLNTDEEFRTKWWHSCEVLEAGKWGQRLRLFYHCFYGEGIIVEPGCSYTRSHDKDGRPCAAIVWSGSGTVNGQAVQCGRNGCDEFLVIPGHDVTYANTQEQGILMVLSVYPIQE